MKLHKKLIMVIVASLIASMLLLATVVFMQLRHQSEVQFLYQTQLLLEETRKKAQSFSTNAVANAKLFASSNLMDRYVRVVDENQIRALTKRSLLREFSRYQKLYPEYLEIRLILPNGYVDTHVVQPGTSTQTSNEYSAKYFELISQSTGEHLSAVVETPFDEGVALLVSIPIRLPNVGEKPTSDNQPLRAYLALTVSLEMLRAQVEMQRIGSSGYQFAVDENQQILFHPDQNMVGKNAPYDLKKAHIGSVQFDDMGALKQLHASQTNAERVYLLGTQIYSELALYTVLPDREFLPVVQKLGLSVAVVCLLAIATTSLLIYALISRLVLLPLSQLRDMALHIRDDKDVDMEVLDLSRGDEIGDLGRAFYGMNSKLSQSMQNLKSSYQRIKELAYVDSLTGLPNRRKFMEMLSFAVHDEGGGAIYYLDLDDFKQVNDKFGHESGDTLLREVARRLQVCSDQINSQSMRNDNSDLVVTSEVARLGGDEFVFLTRNLADPMDAGVVVEQFLEQLRKPVDLDDQEYNLNTSVGISCYPENGDDIDHLMQCADVAMYEAKRWKDSGYRFYSNNMDYGKQERKLLEDDLRQAISAQKLALYFQPQVETRTRRIVAVEALLRWEHPVHGFISPEQFVGMAEDMGLIGELGEWVLDKACSQWSHWREQGLELSRIAVNVSAKQFGYGYLPDSVSHCLQKYDMPAAALELEITESCMMDVKNDVMHALSEIRDSGVRIAMDDFGTGYSSLGSLNSLPIDILKIDRSFVTGVQVGETNEKIVSAILSLAHKLGLEIVAEGVEYESDYSYLLARHCQICQGYLFARPLSAKDATTLLFIDRNPDAAQAA